MSSHCRCLKYATVKGLKVGKNTERDAVAGPSFTCFGSTCSVDFRLLCSINSHSVGNTGVQEMKVIQKDASFGCFSWFWTVFDIHCPSKCA